ncbi:hypothetical protein [Mycobacterium tuberculosis]|uniref:hypothetical protein n=1 Tax=Mycobacterium tuberculosis TaxID=1773 RepID=UPI000710D7C0|nr:hypothetical protein [Mycobacterium tuberculosis]
MALRRRHEPDGWPFSQRSEKPNAVRHAVRCSAVSAAASTANGTPVNWVSGRVTRAMGVHRQTRGGVASVHADSLRGAVLVHGQLRTSIPISANVPASGANTKSSIAH